MRSTSTLIVLVLFAACGHGDPEGPPWTATDSAGVTIVASSAPVWRGAAPWSISARPALVIGDDGSDEAYTLFRVGAALKLPDGRIAVANRGSSQVRLYDATGAHLLDIGRKGDGPGEFRGLGGVWSWPGDSIAVADGTTSRLTIFGNDGELGRTLTPEPVGPAIERSVEGSFDDGTLLVQSRVREGAGPQVGLFRGATWVLDRHEADGSFLNSIAEQPGGLNWGFAIGGTRAYGVAPFALFQPPTAFNGGPVVLGSGTTAEFHQLGPDGSVVRIARWGVEPRPVTDDVVARFRAERLEPAGASQADARRISEAFLDGIEFPAALPVYQSLLVDAEGYVWVERYRSPWETEIRWWVFDPEGRWLGEFPIPSGLTLREIGTNYLLGIVRDENDVERVARYDLMR